MVLSFLYKSLLLVKLLHKVAFITINQPSKVEAWFNILELCKCQSNLRKRKTYGNALKTVEGRDPNAFGFWTIDNGSVVKPFRFQTTSEIPTKLVGFWRIGFGLKFVPFWVEFGQKRSKINRFNWKSIELTFLKLSSPFSIKIDHFCSKSTFKESVWSQFSLKF